MNSSHFQISARNGPLLFDDRERCLSCTLLSDRRQDGHFYCVHTGSPVFWPASGPVNMDCPLEREVEENVD